jgi:excisionase family DNA binding protein
MAINDTVYYTVEEVSKILKVHENTIYLWIDKGELKAVKIGGRVRIPKECLPQVPNTDSNIKAEV